MQQVLDFLDKDQTIEIIKNRLFFTTVDSLDIGSFPLKNHFFTTDSTLTYINFFDDFGPLSLGCFFRFARILYSKLCAEKYNDFVIYYYTSSEPRKRSNAAFLIGAFCVLYLGISVNEIWGKLSTIRPAFIPFRDASVQQCTYPLSVHSCILAMAQAVKNGFIDFDTFDIDEYEHYEKVENGDFNLIVQDKFIAFSTPSDHKFNSNGFLNFTPPDYLPLFLPRNVKTVIRLNNHTYDNKPFIEAGIEHYDLIFPDGSCPPPNILSSFLRIANTAKGVIAVHCKAGMGRTGTLIGCWMIQNYRISAAEAIAWIRICRPGSVIGNQQHFLVDFQHKIPIHFSSLSLGSTPTTSVSSLPAIVNRLSNSKTRSNSQSSSKSSLKPSKTKEKKKSDFFTFDTTRRRTASTVDTKSSYIRVCETCPHANFYRAVGGQGEQLMDQKTRSSRDETYAESDPSNPSTPITLPRNIRLSTSQKQTKTSSRNNSRSFF